MVSERPERPAISTEEHAMLLDLAPGIEATREVLDDLEEIGVNVERERAQLDATETMRAGLIQRFPPRRKRRSKE